MKTKSGQSQNGSTLAVVIITMVLLIAVVAITTEYTTTVNRHVQRGNTREMALAIGDSCIEVLFANWRTTCRGVSASAPPPSTSSFSAIPTPSPGQFPTLQPTPTPAKFIKRGTSLNPSLAGDAADYDSTYTISNYKVIAVNAEYGALSSASTAPIPMLGQINSPVNTASILPTVSGVYNYIASADITLPALGNDSGGNGKGNVVAKVRRVFQRQQMSPMDFAIFYVDPLEIHPGPAFTVTGPVHTNSDLWTGHDTLTFGDKVTFGGSWSVDFMPGDSTHPETPAAPNYPSGLPPASVDPFELPTIGTVVNANTADGYREIIEPPTTGVTDPYAGQRYWDQAGIIIQVSDNPSSTTKGWDGVKGDDLVKLYTVNSSGVTTQITSGALYNMFAASGAITTNQTIQDNRESASVRVATLDVSKIVTTVSSGNPSYKSTFSNPIVYMYNSSATSSAKRAIRVSGASKLPTSGLTVTSNNPVYIQGDLNTGGTGTAVPSNNASNLNSDGTYINQSNPPVPQVSGYTRAPAAILADAVNILSNNWSDANSTATLSSRPASATTINAAIITGTVPTSPVGGDGDYSGGAENFPRFLEDWTNKSLTYYGSMVELWLNSTLNNSQALGEWHYGGNIYNAPARNWFYDNNFKTIRPPGSVMAMVVTYSKGRWTVQ